MRSFVMPARRLSAAAAVAALALLTTACGGAAAPTAPPPAAATADLVTGTFVGLAGDGKTAVAVVAEPPAAGGTDRAVRVYLCDGVGGLREWFPADKAGNSATIASTSSPASVTTTLAATGISGTATLPDGRALTFTAAPVSGPAGLFDVTLNGTTATGVSTTGQKIEIALAPGSRTTATVDGTPLKSATLAPVQGYQAQGAEPLRVIVLADGRALGASKGRDSGSPGITWSDLTA
jgi:hypothetical protein